MPGGVCGRGAEEVGKQGVSDKHQRQDQQQPELMEAYEAGIYPT